MHRKLKRLALSVHIYLLVSVETTKQLFSLAERIIVYIFFAYRYEAAAMHPLCLYEVTLECHHLTFSVVSLYDSNNALMLRIPLPPKRTRAGFQLFIVFFVVKMSSTLQTTVQSAFLSL